MVNRIESVMLQTMLVPLVLCLQLFGFYVVIHGHYSPGGGFQGGVLLGCSLILPKLVRGGNPRGLLTLSSQEAAATAAVGVMIFAACALLPFFAGADILDYAALPFPVAEAAGRRSLGILVIELGVTMAVAAAIVSIFYTLHGDNTKDSD